VSAGTQQRFRSVRFALYSAPELAAASESLLVGTVGDIDRRIPGNWATRRWHRNKISRNLVSYDKGSAFLISPRRRQGRGMEMPARSAGLDPIVAEIIEAHARTMVDNDNNK
jgi:hypothetical protein